MFKIDISNVSDDLFADSGSGTVAYPLKRRPKPYRVVIADDDEEVHRVTEMIFKGFTFEGDPLEILNTYSAADTIEVFRRNSDIAILFLDVVMEKECSGLDVIKIIREELGNTSVRIVLRTGQPGEAPEEDVIREYDLNDYRLKTELTASRLKTTLYSALRNYRDIRILEKHKAGLEKIIKTTSKLFENNTLRDFTTSMLEELSNFQLDSPEMVYVHETADGLVSIEDCTQNKNLIVAATGKYESYIGKDIEDIPELEYLKHWLSKEEKRGFIHRINEGIIIESKGKSNLNNFIFVDGVADNFDFDLLMLFLSNFAVALDNFILNNMLNATQQDMIVALGDTLESHFEETGNHVKRISEMMYRFCLLNDVTHQEAEMVKSASSMHDLGKIAIPDAILKKPDRLTEDEFEIIKSHTVHGYNILSKSNVNILKIAADIALYHHEKYDGTGYPTNARGEEIPLYARMMALIDVFDAMTHKRVYKAPCSIEETVEYIASNMGSHFDPELAELFVKNLGDIVYND